MGKKIGVFICHCGINISQTVDIDKLISYAKNLDSVLVSTDYKYMCSDAGANLIKKQIKNHKLDSIVIGCCSPRMHEHTFRGIVEEGGLNAFNLEIANIREQCSWAHDDKEKATEKAKALIRAAVAKARFLEPLEPSEVDVISEALVIGGGIAGIQTAIDIADKGYQVHLVEKSPSIGGRMAQLDKTFPTLDCSGCILTPKMSEAANHPNIKMYTYADVKQIEGSIGNFTVTIHQNTRYVDMEKCTGCGDCVDACRMKDRIPSEFDEKLGKRSAIYIPFPQAVPLKCTIDKKTCLMLSKGKCGNGPLCVEACEADAINFEQKDTDLTINVGAIVVATGYDLIDQKLVFEYGYNRNSNVITSMEMERLINSSGPTKGEIILPDSTEKPKSITYILCVGSRDEHTCSWCCRIGCMSALKQLYLLREKLPDVELNLCYMDIRSYGKKYEEFYRTVRGIKTNVFRGRPSEVRKDGNDIVVDVFDTMTGKLFEVKSDMVVLVPALTARHDAEDLARILRISQSPDGFYLEAHPKLRPMDTATGGIFLSGCCQGPKDIQDTVAQASGAASRVVSILAQKTLEVEPLIAVVDEDLCSGCGNCVSICPYQAIELIKLEGGKSQAKVNEALCMGCGACAATCPSSAMQQKGFKDIQMIPVIDEMI